MTEIGRWCLGLPFVRSRPIDREESDRYNAELTRIEVRLKRQRWLLNLALGVAAVASIEFLLQERGATGTDWLVTFFSSVAIWLLIAGLTGSAAEIIFGTRVSRILF